MPCKWKVFLKKIKCHLRHFSSSQKALKSMCKATFSSQFNCTAVFMQHVTTSFKTMNHISCTVVGACLIICYLCLKESWYETDTKLQLAFGLDQVLTLKRFSLYSLSRSLSLASLESFSLPRWSLSKFRAEIILPLPILRPPMTRTQSFSFSRGLPARREPTAAVTWQPPPKLRLCGLSTTSKSSSFTRSLGSKNLKRILAILHADNSSKTASFNYKNVPLIFDYLILMQRWIWVRDSATLEL